MENKFIVLFVLILFLCTTVFAAAPTVSSLTLTPTYTADKNYMKFPITMYVTASGDVNSNSQCWYKVSSSTSVFAGDWNADTNRCTLTGYSSSGTDDFNFSMIVSSNARDANGTSAIAYYWRDSNAPSTAYSTTSTSIVLTATDIATATGNGSGVARIYYNLDGAGWTYSTDNPLTLRPSTGTHNLLYYAWDNLDNNESARNGGAWDVNFSNTVIPGVVPEIIAPQCALVFGGLNTVILGLVAAVVIIILAIGLMVVIAVTSNKDNGGYKVESGGALKLAAIVGSVVTMGLAIIIVIFMLSTLCI
jgi:hypothetical protein